MRHTAGHIALFLALLTGGCGDTALDPFQESDLAFSFFGFLDAGADTQFVRVDMVRQTLTTAPAPLDADVMLEELTTGTRIVLHDSLFRFQAEHETRYAHNFWTAQPLTPRATYRLQATGPDGRTSTARIALPDTFPTPRIRGSTIEAYGIDRLADVQVVYCVFDLVSRDVFKHTISYRDQAEAFADTFRVFVSRTRDEAAINRVVAGRPKAILAIKVVVAAAGPDWPDLAGIDEETLALPQVVTNVEGGVGFVGGIAGKTIPWPSSIPWPPVCP